MCISRYVEKKEKFNQLDVLPELQNVGHPFLAALLKYEVCCYVMLVKCKQ